MDNSLSKEATDWREGRRLRAWELKQEGWSQIEQERAFKGEDAVRFLKHLMRQIPGKLLVVWEALRSIAEGRSRAF